MRAEIGCALLGIRDLGHVRIWDALAWEAHVPQHGSLGRLLDALF